MVPSLRFNDLKWDEYFLGQLTKKVGSGSTPRGGEKVYKTDGVLFIRSQNVNFNKLVTDDCRFIDLETNEKMKGSVVYPNDILLNITGASIGRSCVVPANFTLGNVNQHVCIIRPKETIDSNFLQLYLSSNKGIKQIHQSQTGSGREGLNFDSIKRFKVRIPK